ncbi:MAG: sterol desaturase family protein [Bacteroidota bacterium]
MQIYNSILSPLLINVIRYFLLAGIPFLIFYHLYPKLFQNNKIQRRLAKNKDFVREIVHSLQTTLAIGAIAYLIVYTPLSAYTSVYKDLDAFPLWWLGGSLLVALIIHDAYFYWVHRVMHHPLLFKWVHLIHHRSTNPSPWASYSFHILEAILEVMIAPIILVLVPMHPIAILAFATFSFVFNVYGHLGYEIAPRWFRHSILFEIFNTSVHHNLHHKQFKGNYGYYFRFWDRIMKTENPNYVKEYDLIQERRFGERDAKADLHLKKLMILLLVLGGLFGSTLFGQSSIEGVWKDGTEHGYIKITQVDGKYQGQLIGADDPEQDAKIQSKDAIFVLTDFVQKDESTFCCGTMFLPKYGISVEGKIEIIDEQTLKIHGSYGFISSTRVWKKM